MCEETLFTEALEITDLVERGRFLDRACAGYPELRARLDKLLSQHVQAGSFLGHPPTLPPLSESTGSMAAATGDWDVEATIGPYKLVEVIGEGGMGTVWLAQQQEPVKRLVALKVVKAGMDSKIVLTRFEAERQALALMDHPNIARVLDAGATANGRPYFVMELVKGVPITKFCDDRRLSPHERLGLFVPVCAAVQHAHQKGIIHRDIKPSNVLVTLYDGRPVPKVIDFGVAKATGESLTEKTLVTGLGAVVGTPEYMSPEQAELNQLDIDTRSDVYSLGVLLYELLTGTTPLQRKRVKEAALLEVLRLVREEEPPRPSTRLSTTDELPSIAASRGVEPRQLPGLVRGELDWIVMKALEKDRSRRYDSATGFAVDVQRFLAGEPVSAHPPGMRYRLRKFVSRHRGPVMAGVFVLLALMAGIFGTTWGLLEARSQRDQADTARQNQTNLLRETEWRLYSTQIRLAVQEWESNNPLLALHNLETCQPSLRGWEYDYVYTLFHSYEKSFAHDTNLVCFSPDGRQIAGAGINKAIRVWNAGTGRIVWAYETPREITGISWSPKADFLATSSVDGTVIVWDAKTGKMVRSFDKHKGLVMCVAWSPDGTRLASGDNDGVVRIWNPTTGEEWHDSSEQKKQVNCVAWSADGRLVASGGAFVVVWDPDTGNTKYYFDQHKGWINTLSFSPDGLRLASGGFDRNVRIFDMITGRLARMLPSQSSQICSVAFSPDSQRLAVGYQDGATTLWDSESGRVIRTLKGHRRLVNSISWHPDGTKIVTGSMDGSVKVWDPLRAAGYESRTLVSITGRHSRLLLSHDGTRIASALNTGPIPSIWDSVTGRQIKALIGHKGTVTDMALSTNGLRIATSNADSMVKVWDINTGKEILTFRGHKGRVYCVDWCPEGQTVASGGEDGVIRLWDPITGTEKHAPLEHKPRVMKVAFSHDGKRLASINYGQTIKVWDVASGLETHSFEGHDKPIQDIAWSPDDRLLITGSDDGTVKVWDPANGKEIRTLRGHGGPVYCVAVSPDGTRIASAGDDKTVKLWDTVTGYETLTIHSHTSVVSAIAWSPDGRRLFSGCGNGTIRVWESGLSPRVR